MLHRVARRILSCSTFLILATGTAIATPLPAAAPLVKGVVSDAVSVPLTRDRPGALASARDFGPLASHAILSNIRLTLKRSPASQAALDRLTHDQYTRGTAAYRKWLKPTDLRAYGPAQADIDKVTVWLTSHHLVVNSVSPSGMSIEFSGAAGDVAGAFRTRLDNVASAGQARIANVSAPAIPAALAPVVTGVTLSNFFPKPTMRRLTPNFTIPTKPPYYAVAPADFATIYNINPLRGSTNFYGQPITGAGVTLAVVEQTQILASDWKTFRSAFGLAKYPGTLTQVNPQCPSPGYTFDEGEAALDAEWASAVAPAAHIIEASCGGTSPFQFGVLTALEHLVENGTPATILSISYGGPEVANGFAFQAAWSNLVEEGAAEGKAIFVSTGDSGSSADQDNIASNGLFVNGLSDTAYNVAVGGTDFYDTAQGQDATYWADRNSPINGSAKSYIPEIPWDNSCASLILYKYLKLNSAIKFCNSAASADIVQNGVGGSGSQSVYYTKPDWQLTSVTGMPHDGVRDQPDVSLFAANGLWSHFYVFCMSDPNAGGTPCDYTNVNDVFGNAAGGTSFSAPAFAGIIALVQQAIDLQYGAGVPLGNPNPAFYKIAKAQFQTPLGFSRCDSSLGNKISSACVFNYVTAGNIAEPCYAGTPSCFADANSTHGIGVLGAYVDGKGEFAYPAGKGYSLATGLGSVNVTNLLYDYNLGL